MSDANAWADMTGGDVSEFMQQAVNAGAVSRKTADAVLKATDKYVSSQREASEKDDILKYATGGQ